jgi:hypothetical protein
MMKAGRGRVPHHAEDHCGRTGTSIDHGVAGGGGPVAVEKLAMVTERADLHYVPAAADYYPSLWGRA